MNMNYFAARVAAHLPDWTLVENDNTRASILQRPDGARIHMRLSNNSARIEVSGIYPTTRSYHSADPTITVSPKRAPRDMAEDIQRRFLPEYDRLFAESLASLEEDRRQLQEKTETTKRLAERLGIPYRPPRDLKDVQELSWSEGDFYARVRTENGRVYLDRVSMSVQQFERMVAAIRNADTSIYRFATATSYTPGPWKQSQCWNSGDWRVNHLDEGLWKDVAFCYRGAETEANARLIAAAPDLLEALKRLLDYEDDPPQSGTFGAEVFATAYTAIAKAIGETA